MASEQPATLSRLNPRQPNKHTPEEKGDIVRKEGRKGVSFRLDIERGKGDTGKGQHLPPLAVMVPIPARLSHRGPEIRVGRWRASGQGAGLGPGAGPGREDLVA